MAVKRPLLGGGAVAVVLLDRGAVRGGRRPGVDAQSAVDGGDRVVGARSDRAVGRLHRERLGAGGVAVPLLQLLEIRCRRVRYVEALTAEAVHEVEGVVGFQDRLPLLIAAAAVGPRLDGRARGGGDIGVVPHLAGKRGVADPVVAVAGGDEGPSLGVGVVARVLLDHRAVRGGVRGQVNAFAAVGIGDGIRRPRGDVQGSGGCGRRGDGEGETEGQRDRRYYRGNGAAPLRALSCAQLILHGEKASWASAEQTSVSATAAPPRSWFLLPERLAP